MPSPISHIYHGDAFLKLHPASDEGAFMRGTIFPDIRYLTGMDRTLTHRLGVELSDVIAEEDSWQAGWLFHNWLDVAWASYFVEYGLDPFDHEFDSKYSALKLYEDDTMHDLLSAEKCASLASLLNGDDDTVLTFGVAAEDARRWNQLIADLLRSRDSLAAREKLFHAMHVSTRVIRSIEKHDMDLRAEGVWPDRMTACRRAIDNMY